MPGSIIERMRAPLDGVGEDALADEPRRRLGVLAHRVLLDERAEHVGDVLVERARLALVAQPRRALGDAVREFVADHADRVGEAAEHLAVAVAEHHALAVPEGVVVAVAVVHGGLERHAGVVDRVAGEHAREHLERVAEAVVGLVDGGVARGRLALAAHEPAGQPVGALGVGDATVGLRRGAGARRPVARRAPAARAP